MKYNLYISEYIGTFVLVFVGTGAIIANDHSGGALTHLGVSLAFGLAVLAMIYTIGDISGAHINPAVSIAFMFAGRITPKQTAGYILSQILGGISATLTLFTLVPVHKSMGATLPSIHPVKAFAFEIILTFILMFVISQVATGAKEKGLMAGVAIGFTVAMEALFAGPFTGASMNPARSLAPAIISGQTQHLWVYLTGPVIGAILAVQVCRLMKLECCPEEENILQNESCEFPD